jgi:quercetin dioxygenase-like cupin family protein
MTTTTLQLSDSVTLLVRASTKDLFELEATYAPDSPRPPKHWHPHHDEHFEILDGTLVVGLDGVERRLTTGDTIDIPRGTVHQMSNPGSTATRVRWLNTPAGRVEPYFAAMDRLQRDGKAGLLGLAALLSEYRDVMRPASPVTRTALCVLAPLGRLLGPTA